jgi:hypothetical protein
LQPKDRIRLTYFHRLRDATRLLAEGAFDDLFVDYYSDKATLQTQVGRMVPSKAGARAAKFLSAADVAQNKPNPGYLISLKAMGSLKAWKLVLKGLSLVEGAELLPAPTASFNVNGTDYVAGTVFWTYHSKSRTVDVGMIQQDQATGYHHSVYFTGISDPSLPSSTVGSGILSVNDSATGIDIVSAEGIVVTVETFDIASRTFTASYSFTGLGSTDYTVSGTFTATWDLVVVND